MKNYQQVIRIASTRQIQTGLSSNQLHLYSTSSSSSTQHCLRSLKKYDPQSILQLPFWPAEAQSAFLAIQSFRSELLLIPTSISSTNTSIAQIRYQWWRDAIDSCYQANRHHQIPSNHPLIQILSPAIHKHGLSKYYFTRFIDGLERHYLQPRFASTNDLVSFSQSTTYSNLSLLFQVLNSVTHSTKNDVNTHSSLQTIDHSLSHLSNFLTITKLLKQIPYYLNKRQINFIPIDLMHCSDEDLFRLFRPPSNHYPTASSPSPPSTSHSDRIQSVHSTLLNLLDLASSELVATREVLSPNHTHHHSNDLNHSSPSQPQNEINLDVLHRKISIPDPRLMPLFLTATPVKHHIKKLESLFNSLVHLKTRDYVDKNQLNAILNQFHYISNKADWKSPFQIGFDFFFKKF